MEAFCSRAHLIEEDPYSWLDQTKEEIIEPETAICDPHHHFWDNRLERGYPRYQLDELLADITSACHGYGCLLESNS
jgi:hypothetical protein|tara:strand:- start:92 stop:322 length:231 start_codon:yes stop_codon:yes gene_type:complete